MPISAIDFLNKKSEIISLNHSEHPGDGFSFDIETMNGKKIDSGAQSGSAG